MENAETQLKLPTPLKPESFGMSKHVEGTKEGNRKYICQKFNVSENQEEIKIISHGKGDYR